MLKIYPRRLSWMLNQNTHPFNGTIRNTAHWRLPLGTLSLAVTLATLQPSAAGGQSAIVWNEPTTITVDSGRPLMDALDRLQTLYRFPINYEDVPYEYPPDIKTSLRPDGTVRGEFPVGGKLDVVMNSDVKDVLSAAQQAVDAYENAGYPGRYQVSSTGSAIDVVPVAYRSADGTTKALKPLMSEPVVIPKATRPLIDHASALCAALSKAHGVRVECNPQSSQSSNQVEFGATGEAGRDAASLLIPNYSVRALYEPGDKTYYVSFVPAFPALPKAVNPAPNKPTLTRNPSNQFFTSGHPK